MTEPVEQPAEPPLPSSASRKGLGARVHPAIVVGVLALAILGWQWFEMRAELSSVQAELARRLAAADTASAETRSLARQSQDGLRALQERIGALDAHLEQMQGQQGALDALYQELARTRDERLLAEAEQAINIANQQLQLAGNVGAALLALQAADAQLARADRAHFLPLRKAINRDIDQLKALPVVDVPGMTLKIEGLLMGIDTLPLAFERKPAAATPRKDSSESGPWAALGADIWREIRQLIRIERLDRPDPGLLAPQQVVFLRENLKLRLLDARLALLQRDARVFREDISQARAWVEKYFDPTSGVTQSALETLAQLHEARIGIDLPVLTDSLSALKGVKLLPERAGLPKGGR